MWRKYIWKRCRESIFFCHNLEIHLPALGFKTTWLDVICSRVIWSTTINPCEKNEIKETFFEPRIKNRWRLHTRIQILIKFYRQNVSPIILDSSIQTCERQTTFLKCSKNQTGQMFGETQTGAVPQIINDWVLLDLWNISSFFMKKEIPGRALI